MHPATKHTNLTHKKTLPNVKRIWEKNLLKISYVGKNISMVITNQFDSQLKDGHQTGHRSIQQTDAI